MKLYEQITRMRSLMGLEEKPILKEYFNKDKSLINESNVGGGLLDELIALLRKSEGTLTDSESKYLNDLYEEYYNKFGEKLEITGNMVDDVVRKNIEKILSKPQSEISKMIYNTYIKNVLKKINLYKLVSQVDSLKQKIEKETAKFGNNPVSETGEVNFAATLRIVYEKEGNIDVLADEVLVVFDEQLDKWINSLSPGDVKTWAQKLREKIDYQTFDVVPENVKVEISNSLPSKSTVDITPITTISKEEVSKKLENLASADQTMRFGSEEMDISVDINNQLQLKELMGDDYNSFINNLPSLDDLENVWIIVQHSDNDLEFQKKMLEVFKTNKDNITKKFPGSENGVKTSIAMLEDRVMVNSNTSVSGIRDTGLSDFGDLANGKQLYGSQGGETLDGNFWIPRPIEMDGELRFFNTPQELLDDTEFLNKLNARRTEVGMMPMEDYLKMMNKNFNITPKVEPKPINLKTINDQSVYSIFGKNGDYFSKGITLIRELIDDALSGFNKLYVEGASKQEIDSYLNAINLLKEKFGNQKIYRQAKNGKGVEKTTIDEFVKDIESNFKRIYDSDGNWSPLNKLDTNWKDMPKELTTFIKTTLSEDEYNSLIQKIQDYNNAPANSELKTNLKKILDDEIQNVESKLKQNTDYVKGWFDRVDEVTKNINLNSKVGTTAENKVNELFNENGLDVVYSASDGSPIDVLLNVDQIVNDTENIFGGGVKTVQTKSALYIEEGEFVFVDGKRKFQPKSGTGSYRVTISANQKISKPSQIDLSAFYDPKSGKTIIAGKQKNLIGYNIDQTPIYGSKLETPGANPIVSRYNPNIARFFIEADTPKITN
jgi:hypothetical protein